MNNPSAATMSRQLRFAYPGILEEYLEIAKSVDGEGKRILKTDAFNETSNLPVKGGIARNIKGDVYLVEINPTACDAARALGFNVRWGDIRALPFRADFFDVVLDFSTIDHVREFDLAIREYARTLKVNGTVVIVYWSGLETRFFRGQWRFAPEEFSIEFAKYFSITTSWIIYGDSTRRLCVVMGTKR